MNTYQLTSLTTGLLSDEPLEPEHLSYLHARIQNKAHDCVLRVFIDESEARGLNKAYISRRLGKRPEVVGRCLTAPGNWTLDTVAELLGSMGYDVEIHARSFRQSLIPNHIHDISVYKSAQTITTSGQASVTYAGNQIQPMTTMVVMPNNGIRVTSTS